MHTTGILPCTVFQLKYGIANKALPIACLLRCQSLGFSLPRGVLCLVSSSRKRNDILAEMEVQNGSTG